MKTLSEQVAKLEADLAASQSEVERLKNNRGKDVGVQVGDTWHYRANANRKGGGVYVIDAICAERDEVFFEDGGWSRLSWFAQDDQWVLLGRAYDPKSKTSTGK